MKNKYSWSLIKHDGTGTAHYSKNWSKQDQDEYNAKYYQEHKEKWGIKGTGTKAKVSEWSADDPDFADENYSDSNNIADTDYYAFTNKDGNTIILEEDMKWDLGKTKVDKAMQRRLRSVSDIIDQRQKDGEKTTNDTFRQLTSQAIDGTLDVNEDKKARQKNKLGAKGSTVKVGKYLDDIYSQAEKHLQDKGIDPESATGKAFYEKFNKLVEKQAATI